MPVKIVLYAENIADGTEIVNYAMKIGAALDEYVHTEPPIKEAKPNVSARSQGQKTRVPPDALLDIDPEAEIEYNEGTVRAAIFDAICSLKSLPMTRRDLVVAVAKKSKKSEAQVTNELSAFCKAGVLIRVEE